MNLPKKQKGYIILMVTFFALIIMTSVALTMSFLVIGAQKNAINSIKSTQSYYAAEAGIEDALGRINKNPAITSLAYNLVVNNVTTAVNIPNTVSGSKSVTSQANNNGVIRSEQTVCSIDMGSGTSFYYGIEVGPGGLDLEGNAEVMGNVFSSGNIFQTAGSSTIDNDVVISGNGNSISNVHVKGNVTAYSCLKGGSGAGVVDGNLTYVTGGTHTCTVKGTTTSRSTEIADQPMPIPQSQITDWENTAIGDGTVIYNGNYTTPGTGSVSLPGPGVIQGSVSIIGDAVLTTGPIEITGDLNISGSAILNMRGNVYVKGKINLTSSGQIRLDSAYGSMGGVIIADGTISTTGNVILKGSGQTGSYVMIISNSNSTSAILVGATSSTGAIFYTSAGTLYLQGNVSLAEATGYAVKLDGSSKVQYNTGLVNVYFTSGVGGRLKIISWQEN